MESTTLSQFYKSVTGWPKGQAELDKLVDKIRALFSNAWVGVCVAFLAEEQTFSCGENIPPATLQSVKKLLLHQLSGPTTFRSEQIRQLHLSESILGDEYKRVRLFAAIPVSTSAYQDRQKKEYGWLFVGTEKPMASRDEILAISVAEHLAYLALVQEMEDALEMRGQFISVASHELKTPLTSIYGIVQLQERMLRKKNDEKLLPDQERHYSFTKILIRQVQRLNELIDGLLDLSRIQNGRFLVEPSEADVAEILRDTVEHRLSMIAQEAGVKLNVDSVEHLPAFVDPVRMEEVVSNLVMNAIRFSPEGGVVWIKLKDDPEAGFTLSVRDQGPNVPSDDAERIFHPFERAQRTSRLGGLGLGLFISRQIAQLHGGNVCLVESAPGKGNVFEAFFPRKKPAKLSA